MLKNTPKDSFGVTEAGNPAESHEGCSKDSRIIGFITKGIDKGRVDPPAQKRCIWLEMH